MNFETQERTPKDSAHFYSRVISTNGGVLADHDSAAEHERPDPELTLR